MTHRATASALLLVGAGLAAAAPSAFPDTDTFLLIDRGLDAQPARIVAITDRVLTYEHDGDALHPMPLADCVALVHADAAAPREARPEPVGRLVLADGQQLPGALADSAPRERDVLAWAHPWLGRIDVPLDRVAAAAFGTGGALPRPAGSDVVELVNGDRLEGFVTALGDPITIDVDVDGETRALQIPLARAAGVCLVVPPQAPDGRRLWFADGTQIDAKELRLGDDGYLRLRPTWAADGAAPIEVRMNDVTAILFDARSMTPLSSLAPTDVLSSVPRYAVPAPRVLDAEAPLDLGRIEYRGPLTVRYDLPRGCRRFAAEARIPVAARAWADLELVIRDDDREVYRRRLGPDRIAADVNVPLRGTELTIEITPAGNGPIYDHVVLHRALLLVEP